MSENAVPKTRIERGRQYARSDIDTVYAIFDEAIFCHVGFVDGAQPYVIPMLHARRGDKILLHGSVQSRLQKALAEGMAVCLEVTHLDGILVARSAFHSSANYRAAMIFGRARLIDDPDDKIAALDHLSEVLIPGRNADIRGHTKAELDATQILETSIDRFSAKVHLGMPNDHKRDIDSDLWAGEIPVRQVFDPPVADPITGDQVEAPDYLKNYRRRTS